MPLNIKDLRPHVFAADPQSSEARKLWRYWCKSFSYYIEKYENISNANEYQQKLKQLSADCNFGAVTAQEHKQEAIRDVFISGLALLKIRQRLLEERDLTMQNAFDKVRSLEIIHRNAIQYN